MHECLTCAVSSLRLHMAQGKSALCTGFICDPSRLFNLFYNLKVWGYLPCPFFPGISRQPGENQTGFWTRRMVEKNEWGIQLKKGALFIPPLGSTPSPFGCEPQTEPTSRLHNSFAALARSLVLRAGVAATQLGMTSSRHSSMPVSSCSSWKGAGLGVSKFASKARALPSYGVLGRGMTDWILHVG